MGASWSNCWAIRRKPGKCLTHSKQPPSVAEAPRRCPICGKKMEKVLVGPQSNTILIDRCKKGHGLWFDKGELQDVLKLGSFDKDGKIPDLLGKMYTNPETKEEPTPSQ